MRERVCEWQVCICYLTKNDVGIEEEEEEAEKKEKS